jgi:uncharacterized protein YndB with AHSA1/START domain
MITSATVEINASAEHVWDVFTDVAGWPSWTASVTSLEPLDGAAIERGHRFRIKQPRLPALVWEVSEVVPPRSWTWVVRSVGATTSATHVVTPVDGSSCVVTQILEQRGPLGVVFAAVTRRMTRRYLSLEGAGLKTVSEEGFPLAT